MNTTVDPDWWKSMFDEVYLITDARSVCNQDITRGEVDLICELLPIRQGHRIMDLCGGHGRHSLELCARGYTGCTVLDYSQYLIDHARTQAAKHNYDMDFVRAVHGDRASLPHGDSWRDQGGMARADRL